MNTAAAMSARKEILHDDAVAAPRITKEERARRIEAVNYARASVELEGFKSNPDADAHDQRFINGEISLAEYVGNE
jgi:hypothetical protein